MSMPMAVAPPADSFSIPAASSRCGTGQCPSLATVRSSTAMITTCGGGAWLPRSWKRQVRVWPSMVLTDDTR